MKDFNKKEWLKTLIRNKEVVDTAFTFPSTHIRYAHICFVPSSAGKEGNLIYFFFCLIRFVDNICK